MTIASENSVKKLKGIVGKKVKVGNSKEIPYKLKLSVIKKILISKKNTFKEVLKTTATKVKGEVELSSFGFSFNREIKGIKCFVMLKVHDDRIALTCVYADTKVNKTMEKILHDRYYVLLPTFASLLLSKLKISVIPKVAITAGYIGNVFPISGRFKTWAFKLKE